MRIVFAGTPEYAVPSLRALVRGGHRVVGVLTREPAPTGRKQILVESPVARVADELGLPVRTANRPDAGTAEWVSGLGADLGVIVAYGGLLREPLLTEPTLGWINLHFSELPRWRGAAPVQRALMAGEQRLGLTVFRLVEALDAGDVLSRDSREFAPGTSAGAALTELAEYGTAALERAILELARDPRAGEPQQGEASYAGKLLRADGRLDLSRPAGEVLAQWAGVTPEPGAFVHYEKQPLKLLSVAAREESSASPGSLPKTVGEVRLVSGRSLLRVSAGLLELLRVQPPGKPGMSAADWLRGRGGTAVVS
ncbi:methionyl-tRNA formyltransferase [Leucobacter weissii]|uniref:Methionyl-tRNA formyltransferase n=1 Tax=Leucobacter weissii TaxID=1983706 RepID=A0A939SBD1_9MICO|nr:methionyl-tRNA formyltransferase [Leucobacter weissii]MBO1902877.1 methionyl-tRNA formyltransferase [Leucobacter weissii]